MVENTEARALLRRWPDVPDASVMAYTKLEITAEKLRCVMQRLQCRDLADLDLLVGSEDLTVAADLFRRKAKHRGLDPSSFAEKFEKRVEGYKARWEQELGEYLADPPHFEAVERNVRRALRKVALI